VLGDGDPEDWSGISPGILLPDRDEVLEPEERHGPVEDRILESRQPSEASELATAVAGRAKTAEYDPRLVDGEVVTGEGSVEGVTLGAP